MCVFLCFFLVLLLENGLMMMWRKRELVIYIDFFFSFFFFSCYIKWKKIINSISQGVVNCVTWLTDICQC